MNGKVFPSLLFASLCGAMCTAHLLADDPSRCHELSVIEVDDSVRLVGRLGKPLGTMVSVVGTWNYPEQSKGPTKDDSLRFTVTLVNGKSIKHPIAFPIDSVAVTNGNNKSLIPPHDRHSTLDGKRWSLRVYETGRYTVVPEEYWAHMGHPAMVREPPFASSIVGFPERN